jgi:hypothetical protein
MLAEYLYDTRDLLRDSAGQFYSNTQIIRYINGARTDIAKITQCIRVLVPGSAPFGNQALSGEAVSGGALSGSQGSSNDGTSVLSTTPGQEFITFQSLNPFVKQLYGGAKGIIAVNNLAISWGGWRPQLAYLPWQDLQAYARSVSVLITSNPYFWSVLNDGETGQMWIFPTGSSGWEMELDCNLVPAALYSDTDIELLPDPWRDGVKYYAARRAYLASQRFGMAQEMKNEFYDKMGIDRFAVDPGKTEDYYFDNGF